MITRALLMVAAVTALLSTHAIAAVNSTPALDAFNAEFAKVNDYTYKVHSHEVKGNDVQDRVYDYSFMKPNYAKTLIESGAGRGSGGVWTGGDRVSGHQGGFLAGIHLKVGLHDGRAVSLRGYTIPDGLIQNIVGTYSSVGGTLTQSDGGKIDGVDTDLVDLKVADPATYNGISEQKIYFSRETHWPVHSILYDSTGPVVVQTFTDIKTNVGLSTNDFPF